MFKTSFLTFPASLAVSTFSGFTSRWDNGAVGVGFMKKNKINIVIA